VPNQPIPGEESRIREIEYSKNISVFALRLTQTKQNKTKQNKTKQNKTKQNKTKQNKTKQNNTPRTFHPFPPPHRFIS